MKNSNAVSSMKRVVKGRHWWLNVFANEPKHERRNPIILKISKDF